MKKLTIRNLGPIREAEIELGKINLIIGPQSMGKSCVLKTASMCSWVEKKIELAQTTEQFANGDDFLESLITFHRMEGYERPDTWIAYESDYMTFTYDNTSKKLTVEWKEDKRWMYRRPQIAYIPSERNLVAAISNWLEVRMGDDNIRNFMTDWEEARKNYQNGLDILNLGVAYRYERSSHGDFVSIGDKKRQIRMGNASSGLQSIVPLYVYVDYITHLKRKSISVDREIENEQFRQKLYEHLVPKGGHPQQLKNVESSVPQYLYPFSDRKTLKAFTNTSSFYILPQHCELFIEEPENNLFPPTQCQLAEWLIEKMGDRHQLFIATHSPYVLSSFVESDPKDFRLFFLKSDDSGLSTVRTATYDDISEICYYGTDPFINIEAYG